MKNPVLDAPMRQFPVDASAEYMRLVNACRPVGVYISCSSRREAIAAGKTSE